MVFALLAVLTAPPARAQTAGDFYKGDPLTGPEIEKRLATAYSAPKGIVADAAKLVP